MSVACISLASWYTTPLSPTPSLLHTHTNTCLQTHTHTHTPLRRTPQCGSPCGPPLSTRRTRRAPRQSRGSCDQGRVWQEDRGSGSKPCGLCHRPQTLRWCPCGKSRAQGVGAMRTLGAGQLGGNMVTDQHGTSCNIVTYVRSRAKQIQSTCVYGTIDIV